MNLPKLLTALLVLLVGLQQFGDPKQAFAKNVSIVSADGTELKGLFESIAPSPFYKHNVVHRSPLQAKSPISLPDIPIIGQRRASVKQACACTPDPPFCPECNPGGTQCAGHFVVVYEAPSGCQGTVVCNPVHNFREDTINAPYSSGETDWYCPCCCCWDAGGCTNN